MDWTEVVADDFVEAAVVDEDLAALVAAGVEREEDLVLRVLGGCPAVVGARDLDVEGAVGEEEGVEAGGGGISTWVMRRSSRTMYPRSPLPCQASIRN